MLFSSLKILLLLSPNIILWKRTLFLSFFFEVGFFPPGDLLANFITVTEKLLQPHAE